VGIARLRGLLAAEAARDALRAKLLQAEKENARLRAQLAEATVALETLINDVDGARRNSCVGCDEMEQPIRDALATLARLRGHGDAFSHGHAGKTPQSPAEGKIGPV
jgi:hypothetical protein